MDSSHNQTAHTPSQPDVTPEEDIDQPNIDSDCSAEAAPYVDCHILSFSTNWHNTTTAFMPD